MSSHKVSSVGDRCLSCELGYYPDENGGCSNTNHCQIASKGECLKCKDDFLLVQNTKNCKYLYSDDFKNCEVINQETGFCDKCKENFYLNGIDKKCIDTQGCSESFLGVCQVCNLNYYLNKPDDTCKPTIGTFKGCKLSVDGKTCDECSEGYFMNKAGDKCVTTKFCQETDESGYCSKCIEGYYLTGHGNICTKEKNCYQGNGYFGKCLSCRENNYLDLKEGICKSNQEENDFKNCENSYEVCIKCKYNTFLSEDNKCTSTDNCVEVENGNCTKCKENFYLGLDHKCSSVEHCIYSNTYTSYSCIECEKNYYYNKDTMKCEKETEKYLNCKSTDYDGKYCDECRNNYYLSQVDHLCYSNTEKDEFYKCKRIDRNGTYCISCESDYHLGYKDDICSKVEGCAISENENKCIECEEFYCLDLKKGICFDNTQPPEEEDKRIYFGCNKTNENGTGCAECIDENYVLKNGLCFNLGGCVQNEKGECIGCKEWEETRFGIYGYCINKNYGCVEGYTPFCQTCNNDLDFTICDQCMEGYALDEFESCSPIKKDS